MTETLATVYIHVIFWHNWIRTFVAFMVSEPLGLKILVQNIKNLSEHLGKRFWLIRSSSINLAYCSSIISSILTYSILVSSVKLPFGNFIFIQVHFCLCICNFKSGIVLSFYGCLVQFGCHLLPVNQLVLDYWSFFS